MNLYIFYPGNIFLINLQEPSTLFAVQISELLVLGSEFWMLDASWWMLRSPLRLLENRKAGYCANRAVLLLFRCIRLQRPLDAKCSRAKTTCHRPEGGPSSERGRDAVEVEGRKAGGCPAVMTG